MPICPFCYYKRMRKFGVYRYKDVANQKWLCERCGGVTAYPLHRVPKRRPRKYRSKVLEYR